MEPIDDLSSTITATLHIFDQKYQTLFVKLNSAIEDQEGVYMNLVHTGSLEHTAQSFSLQPKIRVLQLVLLKLRGQIIIGKHSEPLSNLTLVLPDADATCRLLYDALEDLATHISQAHYQNEPQVIQGVSILSAYTLSRNAGICPCVCTSPGPDRKNFRDTTKVRERGFIHCNYCAHWKS
ncbi:hypothetical protein C8R41DRAFT_913753 [Lentinula lateritia]|uniref:Uncharacterized protein n=1 Tax=Lentinula lateritia TaxID=40482 RepID=A0ABQ8VXR4_9AGAR|nr:hypothetical protein C8R41DRAFT_913753 [Lentinula lateritia]